MEVERWRMRGGEKRDFEGVAVGFFFWPEKKSSLSLLARSLSLLLSFSLSRLPQPICSPRDDRVRSRVLDEVVAVCVVSSKEENEGGKCESISSSSSPVFFSRDKGRVPSCLSRPFLSAESTRPCRQKGRSSLPAKRGPKRKHNSLLTSWSRMAGRVVPPPLPRPLMPL